MKTENIFSFLFSFLAHVSFLHTRVAQKQEKKKGVMPIPLENKVPGKTATIDFPTVNSMLTRHLDNSQIWFFVDLFLKGTLTFISSSSNQPRIAKLTEADFWKYTSPLQTDLLFVFSVL